MKPIASILAAATLGAVCHQAALAAPQDSYPDKPVKVVVGYAPGGSSDTVARLIAGRLSEKLGQTFVVENRPGAASNIAATSVARSPADGYTLLLGSNASTINMSLYKDLPFDFQKDFEPVALLTRFPNIMVVNPSVPATTIDEFVAYAKGNPQGIFFASSGAGSSTRLSAELFKMMTGAPMEHVQYKGSAPALTDLMAGRVQVMFDTAPSVMPLIQGGKLRALGVTSAERQSYAPAIPTVEEGGVKDYEVTSWYGLFAPAGTPAGIVEKLNQEVNAILEEPDTKEKLAGMVATPGGGSIEDVRQHVASEVSKWAEVVKASGATVD